ncbi:hypothetical protein MLD38_027937 [Melastoma candidum]|uniref:Uncharacterized protein n=1 Tax=Melastoma candidum TaxID=119954 RepID=A0ACB9MZD0_9MYRT|nr:hypothetical protein MLD38_027937 [Melastoma candidum]
MKSDTNRSNRTNGLEPSITTDEPDISKPFDPAVDLNRSTTDRFEQRQHHHPLFGRPRRLLLGGNTIIHTIIRDASLLPTLVAMSEPQQWRRKRLMATQAGVAGRDSSEEASMTWAVILRTDSTRRRRWRQLPGAN